MHVTWERDDDMAYIALSSDRGPGCVSHSVPLEDLANDEGETRTSSLVLDFDAEGRLIGIEVFEATRTLHPSLLGEIP